MKRLLLAFAGVLFSGLSYGNQPVVPIQDGLVLHYGFNALEAAFVPDDSGHGLDGSGTGFRFEPFGVGQVLELDSGDYVECPTNPVMRLGTSDAKSYALWWKADTLIPQNVNLFSKRSSANQCLGPQLVVEYGRQYYLCIQIDHWVKFRPATLTSNAWNHVVLTKTGTTWRIYHNGNELPVYSSMGWPASADVEANVPLLIGKDQLIPAPFDGQMDDFLIYNRVLDSNEVKSIYNAGTQALAKATLTVEGSPAAIGIPSPQQYGSTLQPVPHIVSNKVSAVVAGEPGVRHACLGWAGSGSAPAQGTTNKVMFTMTRNTTVTWRWQTEYRLEAATSGDGYVDVEGSWKTNGEWVTISATPAEGFRFVGWSGEVTPDEAAFNPLTFRMTGPKAITALFEADAPPSTGLVLHYTFDQAPTGSVTDSSGWSNHGIPVGVAYTPDGIMGGAFVFDGTNDYVDAGNTPSLQVRSNFTLSAWIYPESLTGPMGILAKSYGYPYQNRRSIEFYYERDDQLVGYFWNPAVQYFSGWTATSAIPRRAWTHVVMQHDASLPVHQMRMYVNGKPVIVHHGYETISSIPVVSTIDEPWRVGSLCPSEGPGWGLFKGKLDDVRIYNYVLNSNEVEALFAAADQTVLASFMVSGYPVQAGNPTPHGYGTRQLLTQTVLTNSVASPVNGGTGVRYACTGWTGTGDVPASGTGNAVTFTLMRDSSLTWRWATEYWLDTGASGGGTVDQEDGWHRAGAEVTLTASAEAGYRFAGWDGQVPAGQETANPLTIGMETSRQVYATFTPENLSPDEMVLHYTFDDDEGSLVKDETPNAIDGTGFTLSYSAAGLGQALDLGTNTYVEVPDHALMGLGAADSKTFSLWWKADTLVPQNVNLFSKRSTANNCKGLQFLVEYGQQYYICLAIDHWVKFRPSSLAVGEWNHVVLTKTGSTWRVYHNGAELPVYSSMGWPTAADVEVDIPFWLGKDQIIPAPFDGQMEDFRIYGRTLNSNEVSSLYEEGLAALAEEPVNVVTVVTDRASVSVAEGSTASFDVKLSAKPAGTTIVAVSPLSGDEDLAVFAGATLTFTTNDWNLFQTVTLAAAEDNDDNLDGMAVFTCGGEGVTNVTVDAYEVDDDFTLQVTSDFGEVLVSPDLAYYDAGTSVTLTAIPDDSCVFQGWSGHLTHSDNPATLTMDGDKTVTAVYLVIAPEVLPPADISKTGFTARWKWVDGMAPEGEITVTMDGGGVETPVPGFEQRYVVNHAGCPISGLVNTRHYWYRVRQLMPDGSAGPWSKPMKVRTGKGMPAFRHLLSDAPVSRGISQRFELAGLVSGVGGTVKVKSSNPEAVKTDIGPAGLTLNYLWKNGTESATVTLTLTHPLTGYRTAYAAYLSRAAGSVAIVSVSDLAREGATAFQELTVENRTGKTLQGIRIRVDGLDRSGWLLNRTGLDPAGKSPVLDIPCVLEPGEQRVVRVILDPAYMIQTLFRRADYKAWAILPPFIETTPEEMGAVAQSDYDGHWLLRLPVNRNRLYTVSYSDDNGGTWTATDPVIRSTANYLLWLDLDQDAPETRVYRVEDSGL